MYDEDRLREIENQAEAEAGNINRDLASQIARMQDIRRYYTEKRPLEIHVPFLPALLAGKFSLFVNSPRIYWYPHRQGKPVKDGGLFVDWGTFKVADENGRIPQDREQFTLQQLVSAPPPDYDYVWYIDFLRGLQSRLNVLRRFLGMRKIRLIEGPGGFVMNDSRANEQIFVPLVGDPRGVVKFLSNVSNGVLRGESAKKDLRNRKDKRR